MKGATLLNENIKNRSISQWLVNIWRMLVSLVQFLSVRLSTSNSYHYDYSNGLNVDIPGARAVFHKTIQCYNS
jgi:hypothetical protein